MDKKFEEMLRKLSPTLRRITHKLNGHFTFFDEDDLFQEALEHLWMAFQDGSLGDKTDSYVLQGCYFHLKNYIRKTADKAKLISDASATAVANTIGSFISLEDIDRVLALTIVLCGLVGAIAWNLLTWWRGIPSSSSHTSMDFFI